MMETDLGNILQIMSQIDPGPFFGLSIIPYLIFLFWIQKSQTVPKLAAIGFGLTLVFVAMTIVCAIFAQQFFNAELTDVDPLHGAAETFLCISDALIVLGFFQANLKKEMKNS